MVLSRNIVAIQNQKMFAQKSFCLGLFCPEVNQLQEPMSRSLFKVQNELQSVFLSSFEVYPELATCPESKTKNLMSRTKNLEPKTVKNKKICPEPIKRLEPRNHTIIQT
jgi:hypothetical protein